MTDIQKEGIRGEPLAKVLRVTTVYNPENEPIRQELAGEGVLEHKASMGQTDIQEPNIAPELEAKEERASESKEVPEAMDIRSKETER